jgi:AcrR family transcriptional regulator
VRLFAERGYDAVSMTEVAEAAGLSRRALFNYFPSKAALVWVGFEPFTTSVRSSLDAAPSGRSLLTSVEQAVLDGFASLDAAPGALRTRLQIIHDHPDLLTYGTSGLFAVRTTIQEHIDSRLGSSVPTLEALALAEAVTSVSFTAFQQWAVASTDDSPAAVLRTMFGALSRGLSESGDVTR